MRNLKLLRDWIIAETEALRLPPYDGTNSLLVYSVLFFNSVILFNVPSEEAFHGNLLRTLSLLRSIL